MRSGIKSLYMLMVDAVASWKLNINGVICTRTVHDKGYSWYYMMNIVKDPADQPTCASRIFPVATISCRRGRRLLTSHLTGLEFVFMLNYVRSLSNIVQKVNNPGFSIKARKNRNYKEAMIYISSLNTISPKMDSK